MKSNVITNEERRDNRNGWDSSMYAWEARPQMREGAAVGIMTSHLILSLTFTPK